MSDSRIIVALDYADPAQALAFVDTVTPEQCRVKVGKELFCRGGPSLVGRLVKLGFDVFLDLKFHDIPNTVAQACRAAADLGVWMINVHALGGLRMMEAARTALLVESQPPLLIAVTILTSHTETDLRETGLTGDPASNVLRLSALARRAGLDGVVCSPQEIAVLRKAEGDEFCLVTPGIRPADSGPDDQRRIMTPWEAMVLGSNYLVIGRPVTAANDPAQALKSILASL